MHGRVTERARALDVVPPPAGGNRRWLRWALVASDGLAALFAWCTVLVTIGAPGPSVLWAAAAIGATLATLAAAAGQGLYLSRVAAVRSEELSRGSRAAAVSAAGAWAVFAMAGRALSIEHLALGGAIAFVMLAAERSLFDAWLRLARARGEFTRPVVVVGTNEEAAELCRLLQTHPEVGLEAVAAVGERRTMGSLPSRVPVLGDLEQIDAALRRTGANGVLIASSALNSDELNDITRQLVNSGVHVHMSNGLRGISAQRLRSLPVAHEPLFYLERIELSPWQTAVKRVIDVSVSVAVLLVSLPLLLLAAGAIRVLNGKPVFFRQERIGKDGRPFMIMKFRTMAPDAEARLGEVTIQNERAGGPLFKMANDPRRTKLGAVLEALSLDELPQLFNVLRGEMSLVGPRPALAHEVAQFDDELLARLSVLPGVTGLWQVEARDNPEFHAYRRLDLFYVENWSVAFDISILLSTVRMLIVRVFTSLLDRTVISSRGEDDPIEAVETNARHRREQAATPDRAPRYAASGNGSGGGKLGPVPAPAMLSNAPTAPTT
jgi:exopolysaccharide biosynthesis polyprenyl glycosylphosphotransferase